MDRKITWLRGAHCDEGDGCEAAARIDGVPGVFIVSRIVTNPQHLAAFASRIAEGEILSHVTDDLFPELSPSC